MANLKDALDIGLDLGAFGLEIKNWRDIARMSSILRSGVTSFFGKKLSGGEKKDGEVIEENEMQLGELYSFLGYLSAIRMSNTSAAKPITSYMPKPAENEIFTKILKAMKPGAAKLLTKTIGVNLTKVRRRRVVGETEIEIDGSGGKKKKIPITEDTEEVVNITGPQIVGALTWLALQGNDTEDERIKRVVANIEAFQLFNSKLDAAKELGAKSTEEAKRLIGWLYTNGHILFALVTLGPRELQRLLEHPRVNSLLDSIKGEKEVTAKRTLQERFQRFLVEYADVINREATEADRKSSRRFWVWAIIIALLVILVFAIAPHIDAFSSLIGE